MTCLDYYNHFSIAGLLATAMVACGGSVDSEDTSVAAPAGGSSAVVGVGINSGGSPVGTGGSISTGGGADASVPLPRQCVTPFDPGYICSSAAPFDYTVFDQTLGKCVTVQYNGCGGATTGAFNAYSELGQCEVLCEQKASDPSCPLSYSPGAACTTTGAICSYGGTDSGFCLCTLGSTGGCLIVDPRCSSATGLNSMPFGSAACTSEVCTIQQADIIIVLLNVCACESGKWQCSSA